ncbi:hypothetical protein [Celerinatantimonas yamalensis]|uniref:Peptidoglycan binding protein n=1 Tax=Celerinatantimonas yamalensis TaxID=559956 RepID=A0ABW9G1S9_9GAMM
MITSVRFMPFGIVLYCIMTFSAHAASPSIWDGSAYTNCYKSLPSGSSDVFGKITQQQLQSLYEYNPTFIQSLKNDGHLLDDGLYGPKTRTWLAYFCAEFAVIVPKNQTRFVQTLQTNLTQASQINTLYPHWRKTIAPNQLLHLSAQELQQDLTPKPPHIEPSTPQPQPQPSPPQQVQQTKTVDYYQLSAVDLNALADQQAAIQILNKLSSKQFDQRTQLFNALREPLTQLGHPELDLNGLIESQPLKVSASSNSQTQSSTTTKATYSLNDQHTTQVRQTTESSQTKTQTPALVWQINSSALKKTLEQLKLVAISKDSLNALQPLQGEVFAGNYLFDIALKLAGISPSSDTGKSIIQKAGKQGISPKTDRPTLWRAPSNCGCEDSKAPLYSADIFYGFYPYWLHPKEGQLIHFSQLDRIGYVGATLKPTDNGGTLILPPNWTTEVKDSEFIQTAHRYRTDIDLVVSASRHLSEQQLTGLFTTEMIKQLVDSVQQPLNKHLSNRMHPLFSLGMTHIPTIADGITLDLDLTTLQSPDSQKAFLAFIRALKASLLDKANTESIEAHAHDRYYLNVIIPIQAVLAADPHSFYTFSNLDKLSKISNLLIMRPGSATQTDKSDNELSQIRGLLKWLSNQPEQDKTAVLYQHMIPMLITAAHYHSYEKLNQLVHLSSWSLLGAAYWPTVTDSVSQQFIQNTFYSTQSPSPTPLNTVIAYSTQVLNWICPNRWLLRLILFGVFSVIIVILLASIWYYPWRKFIASLPFVTLCSAAIFGLMLVFIADPYFKNMQGPIMLGFAMVIGAILMGVRVLRKEGDKP